MKHIYLKVLSYLKILFIFAFLTIGSFTVAGQNPNYDSIGVSIENLMIENNIPGLAVSVIKNNKIEWSESYGQADLQNKVPMSLDVIMNIGSISKTFTTTAAMQLWEKGLLDLDADINKYLDFEVRNPNHYNKPITVFQILTHTSSIRDGKAYSNSYTCGDPTVSLNEWIYSNLNSEGKYYDEGNNFSDWAPGSNRKYSNIAFGLLGLVVEKITKTPFNEYTRDHIFKPLGMKNTGWFLSEIDTANHVSSYVFVTEKNRDELLRWKRIFPKETEFRVGSFIKTCLYSFPNYPDGLVRTSIRELSFYLIAMINGGQLNGTKLLKKETIATMLTLQIEGNNSQGLSWYTTEFESLNGLITLWGHNGGDPGIATNIFFHPDEKVGFITFQNNLTGGAFEIVKELYLTTYN